MTRTIPLKIQNEYIAGDKVLIGAAGSHNDVVLRMEFSPLWEGLTKTVQFRDALGEATIEVLLTADMLEADDTSVYLVPVPNGAKKYAGEMTLCIKGAAVSAQKETRATLAVYGRFTVAESKWSADAETEADVPASNVEKLQGQIDNVLGTIVDARKAATEAAKSAEGAALSQSRAQTSEQYASEYAQGAANSAASASSSATAAASSATAGGVIGTNTWQELLRIAVRQGLNDQVPAVMLKLQDQFEQTVINEALKYTHNHRQKAAQLLGIGRNTITRKVRD